MQTKEIHLWPQIGFMSMVSQVLSSHYLIYFEANIVNNCVYHKLSEGKYIFLVLYIDDILLANSDTGLLHETKRILTKNFEMKDLGEAYFVLGTQILRNCSKGILRLSQENYINKTLNRFNVKDSKLGDTPIVKGDKFRLNRNFGKHWEEVKHVMCYLKRQFMSHLYIITIDFY
ncbi:hypothetical protein CR513_21003, partial [Mucuna pruriens]